MKVLKEKRKYFLTSESVAEGHPDKVCDQISDTILDEILKQDIYARVACETFISFGFVIVGGEITTKAHFETSLIIRELLKEIGYDDPQFGFQYQTCGILNAIGKQSPDIALGVDKGGAGDQGIMIGYACNETEEFMPTPIILAHKLVMELKRARKNKILNYLGPDGKSQVTVEYQEGIPKRVDSVVLSFQHTKEIVDKNKQSITEESRKEVIEKIIKPVLGNLIDEKTKYYINPTGLFLIGGPQSDTGMTGRKLIVDTYGGVISHGGGAFSGKDPTKVDRSAAYMMRYICKNIVAAGAAEKCIAEVAYAIGVREPLAFTIDTLSTGKIKDEELEKIVKQNFDLTPQGIIEYLNLRRPIYAKTACFGHFGRKDEDFTWEKTDKINLFKI